MYTQTIKLCLLDVNVCQFQLYERILFNFSRYQLWSFKNVLHLKQIHLIISRAANETANTSTRKIKSHNVKSFGVRHNPDFKHI